MLGSSIDNASMSQSPGTNKHANTLALSSRNIGQSTWAVKSNARITPASRAADMSGSHDNFCQKYKDPVPVALLRGK
jgi:hypothetical protein